ncbi:MAG: hypothetical protein JNK72_25840 [Myxococcales bacterium]|nr:hypothetical protein [Myxococcales bacterium]
MDVVVAHHGYCFDGAASAALFYRFVSETMPAMRDARFEFRGLMYEPNAPSPATRLKKGALNAILDYRYTASPLIDWYFDHHVSAFQESGSEAHFRADTSGQKFHDGAYGSCTKYLADVTRARFGWAPEGLDELIHWADVIDAARFSDAEQASSFAAPAMAITAVIQEQGDEALTSRLIPLLATRSLAEVAASPEIVNRLGPIKLRHEAFAKRMGQVGEQLRNVALFDLSDQAVDTVAKFVGYQLFPTAVYSVMLSRSPKRVKISVGFNPWSKKPRAHNIAALCEKYGGGGHPVVGAVTLPPHELGRARTIVQELVTALNR